VVEGGRDVYEFDEFRLDALKRQLTRQGEVVPIYSKAFDLLLALVQNAGRDLTKDELLEKVWPGQILEESNLPVNISAVRRALGESANEARFIITVPGRGYRFVAAVSIGRGLMVQSETISRITIEQETDDDPPAITDAPVVPALPAASIPARRNFFRTPLGLAALLLFGSVVVIAAVFSFRWMRASRATANRFQQIKLRQLTNDGGVISAALSPDARFFAVIRAEKTGGRQTLRLALSPVNTQG
jgi:DNA-binding winged helix-turn-helix (wHTH) protein